MPRPENPEVPTNAVECLAIIAEEACKAKPNLARLRYIAIAKEGFEAKEQRERQAVQDAERKAQQAIDDAKEDEETAKEDALREREVEASLQASTKWRTETAAAIRAEITAELHTANLCKAFEEKQALNALRTENTRLQEQFRTAQQTGLDALNEVTALHQSLQQAKEHIQTLLKDNEELRAQVAPVDPELLQAEYQTLKTASDALQKAASSYNLRERLQTSTRLLFLHTQIVRIKQGETIRQFEFDLAAKESEWANL